MIKEMEELQELIAKMTIRLGVERVITQDILHERCKYYMTVAKHELDNLGPEDSNDSSKFIQTATVFGSRGEEAPNIRCGFKGTAEKRAVLQALSDTCRTILAQAVILRVVGTAINTEIVAKEMGVKVPDTFDGAECFHQQVRKWMRQVYRSERFAELPPKFRHDFIIVSGMGPKLEDCGVTCEYRWERTPGKASRLIFENECDNYVVRLEMMPRWWQ